MRGPLIGEKDFQTTIGQGEQAPGESWRCTKRERSILCFLGKKKEENGSVRKRLVFYVWKGVVKKKKMCANKNMEGSCV